MCQSRHAGDRHSFGATPCAACLDGLQLVLRTPLGESGSQDWSRILPVPRDGPAVMPQQSLRHLAHRPAASRLGSGPVRELILREPGHTTFTSQALQAHTRQGLTSLSVQQVSSPGTIGGVSLKSSGSRGHLVRGRRGAGPGVQGTTISCSMARAASPRAVVCPSATIASSMALAIFSGCGLPRIHHA